MGHVDPGSHGLIHCANGQCVRPLPGDSRFAGDYGTTLEKLEKCRIVLVCHLAHLDSLSLLHLCSALVISGPLHLHDTTQRSPLDDTASARHEKPVTHTRRRLTQAFLRQLIVLPRLATAGIQVVEQRHMRLKRCTQVAGVEDIRIKVE